MVGLKTQESSKFTEFWKIVQTKAAESGKVFFLEAGEGRDFENETIECEDLSGFLIPKGDVNIFENEWKNNSVSDKWLDFLRFAIWKKENGKIDVDFEDYGN